MKKSISCICAVLIALASSTSFIQAEEGNNVLPATKCALSSSTRVMNPCDDVLYPNEYFTFNHDQFRQLFRVDALDLATDRAYNAVLDAWLPLYSLTEYSIYGELGDQVLYVGEHFSISWNGSGPYGSYKVTGNSGTTRIQTIMLNKWNKWEYVWLNCAYVTEYGC